MQTEPIHIIIDTREQAPLAFSDAVAVTRATVPAGDYSLAGHTDRVAIERKSHADAWSSVYTAAARMRITRVLVELGRMNRNGGLGLVAIGCTRDQLLQTPSLTLPASAGRRVCRRWEELCAIHGVEILWGAGAVEVEAALRGWMPRDQP